MRHCRKGEHKQSNHMWLAILGTSAVFASCFISGFSKQKIGLQDDFPRGAKLRSKQGKERRRGKEEGRRGREEGGNPAHSPLEATKARMGTISLAISGRWSPLQVPKRPFRFVRDGPHTTAYHRPHRLQRV